MSMKLGISALVCAFAFSGCATLTGGDTQQVSLQTRGSADEPIEKATCTLQNDKGSWNVQSPAVVKLHRSSDDLLVQCTKDGLPDGHLRAISAVKPALFGNILLGGGIGAIVDHSTGSAYDYPDDLSVKMGERLTADRRAVQPAKEVAKAPTNPGSTQVTTAQ
jgi:hypothetical protein